MTGRGTVRIEVEGAVVSLHGELDMEGTPAVERELMALISGEATPDLVVDLNGLGFIDSTGIQCLVRAAERAEETAGTLRFRGAGGQVEDVMRMTGVRDLLQFAD